jgi:hypothetical protein
MKKLILTTLILIGLTSGADASKKDFERVIQKLDKSTTACYNSVMVKDEYDNYSFKAVDMFDACEGIFNNLGEALVFLLDTNNAQVIADCTDITGKPSTCSIMMTQVALKFYGYAMIMKLELDGYGVADMDMTGWDEDYTKRFQVIMKSPIFQMFGKKGLI